MTPCSCGEGLGFALGVDDAAGQLGRGTVANLWLLCGQQAVKENRLQWPERPGPGRGRRFVSGEQGLENIGGERKGSS